MLLKEFLERNLFPQLQNFLNFVIIAYYYKKKAHNKFLESNLRI